MRHSTVENVFYFGYIPQPVPKAVKDIYLDKIEKDIKELYKIVKRSADNGFSLQKLWFYSRMTQVVTDLYHSRRIGLGIYDIWFYQWISRNFRVIDGKIERPYEMELYPERIQWPAVKELSNALEDMLEKLHESKAGSAA